MEHIKPFLVLAAILGVMVTLLQVYFTYIGYQSGDALNATSYLTPVPAKLYTKPLDHSQEKIKELLIKKF